MRSVCDAWLSTAADDACRGAARREALIGARDAERRARVAQALATNRAFCDWLVAAVEARDARDVDGAPVVTFRDDGGDDDDEDWYEAMPALALQLVRDWSAIGAAPRLCERVLAALERSLPLGDGAGAAGRRAPRVLVPGAGLARVAWEIARRGYAVEANDRSRLFATVADAVCNRRARATPPPPPLCAHAHAHGSGYCRSLAARVEAVRVVGPPPPPPDEPIAFRVGDFARAYGDGAAGRFDAVVTTFFVDQLPTTRALDALARALRPGGVWVNVQFGPLGAGFYAGGEDPLDWDDAKAIAGALGFAFVEESDDEFAPYALCDKAARSMLTCYTVYSSVLSVAIKREAGSARPP